MQSAALLLKRWVTRGCHGALNASMNAVRTELLSYLNFSSVRNRTKYPGGCGDKRSGHL